MIEFKLEGVADLEKKLHQLSDKMAAKTLRSAALQATTPAMQAMKMAAPVGKKEHRTYKGRLVAPGFLKRNIKRKTGITKGGQAYVILGVASEAFYGVSFIELGTHKMPAKEWFVKSFEANAERVLDRFKIVLAKKIEAAVKA